MLANLCEFTIYVSTEYLMRYMKWIFTTIMLACLFIAVCSVSCIYSEVSAVIMYYMNIKEYLIYIDKMFTIEQP